MADEVEIRIEPGEPEPGADSGGRIPGPGASSSRRLTRGRSPWRMVVGAAAVAVLVGGGVLTLLGHDESSGRDHDAPAGRAIPRAMWTQATLRLGEAGSFAYRGTVHASAAGPLRPGTWFAQDVSVEGAVLLSPAAITREVAVGPGGEAVETVTSGSTAWSRSAPTAGRLPRAPWRVAASSPPEPLTARPSRPPTRLGLALVIDVLGTAENRRSDPPDGTGDRTLHATVPASGEDRSLDDLSPGAEVSVRLDTGGAIEHLGLTGPAGDPDLAIELDIDRTGDPGLITPADVGVPARRTMPADALDAAGVEAVELGRVPAEWALTDARAAPSGDLLGRADCPQLLLDYRDLVPSSDGWMALSVASARCRARQGAPFGRRRYRVGAFSGSADESQRMTSGMVTDGVTAVSFQTDLSLPDATAVLASLAPFDPAGTPAEIAGVPSS